MELSTQEALELWRRTLTDVIGQQGPDLSSRQLAILLTVYLTPPPHTVRGLANRLQISKPAVVRALDMLGKLDLLRRRQDTEDRRSVLLQRTVKGSVFLSEYAEQVRSAAREL